MKHVPSLKLGCEKAEFLKHRLLKLELPKPRPLKIGIVIHGNNGLSLVKHCQGCLKLKV